MYCAFIAVKCTVYKCKVCRCTTGRVRHLSDFCASPPRINVVVSIFVPLAVTFVYCCHSGVFRLTMVSMLLILRTIALILARAENTVKTLSVTVFVAILVFLFEGRVTVKGAEQQLLKVKTNLLIMLTLLYSLQFKVRSPCQVRKTSQPFV